MRISELLIAMAQELESEDNEALVLAEYDDSSFEKTAEGLLLAAAQLRKAAASVDAIEPDEEMRDLKSVFADVAQLAQELDNSNDSDLQKRASVLDEILLTFGSPKGVLSQFKQAQDDELAKLKEKYRQQDHDRAFVAPKEALDLQNGRKDTEAAFKKQVKVFEPMEASLQTRYCPDHPGVGMVHLADYVYQCNLDNKVYDWQAGFTTMKGNKVPGTSATMQTVDHDNHSQPHSVFNSREQMTQRFASADDELVKNAGTFPEFPDTDDLES